jgi:arginyl-tRNA synthetase
MNVLTVLRHAFAKATPSGANVAKFADAVRPSTDRKFGDYQANGCMAIAKSVGRGPRDLAAEVAKAVDLSPMAPTPEVAGPGFLNVRLHDEWLSRALGELLVDEGLGIPAPEQPLTVVIDYSSPNVAKPMHVGHVRSTVIGEALSRTFAALGHRVVRDNHLGDWGSQFGMILWGWKHHRDEAAYATDPVGELARLYRLAQSMIKPAEDYGDKYEKIAELRAQGKDSEADSLFAKLFPSEDEGRVQLAIEEGNNVANAARLETAKLHAGDPENRALWQQFMPHCLEALNAVYERLGVRFDVQLGESFYDPMLADVVKDLEAKGLAVASEGALVVFTNVAKAPMIVQKRDGAFNYATSDLATIQYRRRTWGPDVCLYVVDHRQGDHFKQLFEVARKAGYGEMTLEHVAFGTVLDEKRRPIKTRAGDIIGLESLLDEAVAKAFELVKEKGRDLTPEEERRVSEIVGLGAIKYADLSQNRLSDYVFDWAKMMTTDGNSGAYLQYAYARVRSIFRKGDITPEAIRERRPTIFLSNPAERSLGLQVLRLPETLEVAAAERKPNILCDYLFDLANRFSTFFDECPVLKAESDERRDSRLALCDLTARTLKFGLNLLGIEVAERL